MQLVQRIFDRDNRVAFFFLRKQSFNDVNKSYLPHVVHTFSLNSNGKYGESDISPYKCQFAWIVF